ERSRDPQTARTARTNRQEVGRCFFHGLSSLAEANRPLPRRSEGRVSRLAVLIIFPEFFSFFKRGRRQSAFAFRFGWVLVSLGLDLASGRGGRFPSTMPRDR